MQLWTIGKTQKPSYWRHGTWASSCRHLGHRSHPSTGCRCRCWFRLPFLLWHTCSYIQLLFGNLQLLLQHLDLISLALIVKLQLCHLHALLGVGLLKKSKLLLLLFQFPFVPQWFTQHHSEMANPPLWRFMGGPGDVDIPEPLIHGMDPSHSGVPLWILGINQLGAKIVGALRASTAVPKEHLIATISLPDTFSIPQVGQLVVFATVAFKGLPAGINKIQTKKQIIEKTFLNKPLVNQDTLQST